MVPAHVASEAACCWIRSVRDDGGELLAETRSYFEVVCVGLVFEFDGLVGSGGPFFVGEPGDEFPEASGVGFVGHPSTSSTQTPSAWEAISAEMRSSRPGSLGSRPSRSLTWSLSAMRVLAVSERQLMWFLMHPVGMWCFAASRRICRSRASPVEQETGAGSLLNLSSVSAVKSSQRAFLRLVNWRRGSFGGLENQSPNWIKIGRWSEFKV